MLLVFAIGTRIAGRGVTGVLAPLGDDLGSMSGVRGGAGEGPPERNNGVECLEEPSVGVPRSCEVISARRRRKNQKGSKYKPWATEQEKKESKHRADTRV